MGAAELPVPCDVIEVEVPNVLALDFVAFDASCFPCHSTYFSKPSSQARYSTFFCNESYC